MDTGPKIQVPAVLLRLDFKEFLIRPTTWTGLKELDLAVANFDEGAWLHLERVTLRNRHKLSPRVSEQTTMPTDCVNQEFRSPRLVSRHLVGCGIRAAEPVVEKAAHERLART